LLICFAIISFISCEDDDKLKQTGTVQFIELEGGFYGIISDDGNKFDPINLDSEFRVDGLRVEFEYKKANGQDSFHMWGTIIEIISIRKI